MAKNKARASLPGRMEVNTKATSRTTTFRGWGSITGKTEENIAEIGRRT